MSSRTRIRRLLSRSKVSDRCASLTRYLNDVAVHREDAKEFYESFPDLLVHIFGFDGKTKSWFSSCRRSVDTDALETLLSPSGVIFRTILMFMNDDNLFYRFPTNRLPAPTRRRIHRRDIESLPVLYKAKFSPWDEMAGDPRAIPLNIFEYYLYCFACFVVYDTKRLPRSKSGSSSSSSNTSFGFLNVDFGDLVGCRILSVSLSLYSLALLRICFIQYSRGDWRQTKVDTDALLRRIVKRYLCYFFSQPAQHTKPSSSSSSSSSPSRHNRLAALSPFTSPFVSPFTTSEKDEDKTSHPKKSSSSSSSSSASSSSSSSSHSSDGECHDPKLSNLFLLVLTEFWMCANEPYDPQRAIYGYDYTTPTSNSLRCLRSVVEHLVAVAVDGVSPEVLSYRDRYGRVQQLPLLTHRLQIIHKPLYSFLRSGFAYWTIGSVTPFSLLVELWLAYVQPWDAPDSPSPIADQVRSERWISTWRPWIYSNLLFYTTLLRDFLRVVYQKFEFSLETDLSMLLNVLTAFSQIDLIYGIAAAEPLLHPNQEPLDRADGSLYEMEQLLEDHFALAEGAQYEYEPLMTPGTLSMITAILQALKAADATATQTKSKKGQSTSGDIQMCLQLLSGIFGIDPSTIPLPTGGRGDATPGARRPRTEEEHWAETTPDDVHLSPLGREQIACGLRKCSNLDVPFLEHGIGNRRTTPIPRPITSHENAALVRFFHRTQRTVKRRFGLSLPDLRWLADYRLHVVLLITMICMWLFWKLCVTIANAPRVPPGNYRYRDQPRYQHYQHHDRYR